MMSLRLMVLLFMFVAMVPAVSIAGPVMFDFRTGGSSHVHDSSSTMTFTEGGISVTAMARWLNTGPADSWGTGALAHYSNGMGILNGKSGDSHTVDNSGYTDYVKFVFSTPVMPTSISLSLYGDGDVSYLFGPYSSTQSDWTDQDGASGSGGSPVITHNLINPQLISEFRFAPKFDDNGDKFKIRSLTVEQPMTTIPAPGAVLLASLGTLGVGWVRRRISV